MQSPGLSYGNHILNARLLSFPFLIPFFLPLVPPSLPPSCLPPFLPPPSLPVFRSLAIIMVEMLTQESPFNEYLDYVEVDEILDAIAGRKKLSTQLPQVCLCQGMNEEKRENIERWGGSWGRRN